MCMVTKYGSSGILNVQNHLNELHWVYYIWQKGSDMWLEEVINQCWNVLWQRPNSCYKLSTLGYIYVGFVDLGDMGNCFDKEVYCRRWYCLVHHHKRHGPWWQYLDQEGTILVHYSAICVYWCISIIRENKGAFTSKRSVWFSRNFQQPLVRLFLLQHVYQKNTLYNL